MATLCLLAAPSPGPISSGEASGSISVLPTPDRGTFALDLPTADEGNFCIVGPKGSGKSIALRFIAAQAQRLNPRLFLFDVDGTSEALIRGMGGTHQAFSIGISSGLNPLALPDSEVNRGFLSEWLACLLGANGSEVRLAIARSVDELYDGHEGPRTLSQLRKLLAGPRRGHPSMLSRRLAVWCSGGEHAWLFDNEGDTLDLCSRATCWNVGELLNLPALRSPLMMYLFHRLEQHLDGSRTMILLEEGWKLLDDEHFAASIADWSRMLHKRNGIMGFTSREARDAVDSRIGIALGGQTGTMVFMSDPHAQSQYQAAFGLEEVEIEALRSAGRSNRTVLIRQPGISALARLDLCGIPDVLGILAGDGHALQQWHQAREASGEALTKSPEANSDAAAPAILDQPQDQQFRPAAAG